LWLACCENSEMIWMGMESTQSMFVLVPRCGARSAVPAQTARTGVFILFYLLFSPPHFPRLLSLILVCRCRCRRRRSRTRLQAPPQAPAPHYKGEEELQAAAVLWPPTCGLNNPARRRHPLLSTAAVRIRDRGSRIRGDRGAAGADGASPAGVS